MSEVKIGKVSTEHKELSSKVWPPDESRDQRRLFLLILGLILVFALALGGVQFWSMMKGKVTGATTTSITATVDELHRLNREGKLNSAQGYIYNGYSVVKSEGLWWMEINKFDTLLKVPLHFGPREVEFIPVNGELDPFFNVGLNVSIAIDPAIQNKFYTLALSELSLNIAKGVGRTPLGSCTREDPACLNRTIINCEETQGKPVIELQLAEKPRVDLVGTCIKIQGKDYNLVRATDRVLYRWYGVMN